MTAIGTGIDIAGQNTSTASNGGTTIAPEVMTYYEKVFLARKEYEFVLKEGAQVRTHPANEGRTVNFTRYNPITINTNPLGEASNPVTCPLNASTVAMTLSEYGITTVHGKLFTTIAIDSGMKEKVAVVGQMMRETLNRLVGLELRNGTSYYGNNHTADTFAAGDTLDACDIRQIVRLLDLNKARVYPSGMFVGKTDPYSKYNLIADTTWVNAKTYSDIGDLYKGEMGELYQVKWLLNKDVLSGIGSTYADEAASSAASLVTRFYTFVHGDESFGVYDLEKDQPKLYIVPNAVDSGSPAGRISLVSWAGSFATKLLNSDWVVTARFASV